ncbi:uncharacterized protein GGS25DRAFT_490794 [Hypoxylon fragiforme]|uniref:uncharacterized protein n=1 Tax=Hypoxylon fragiforme TaxID=63214 RepID=UPI0020C5E4DC|nr:uncharacterized protein GGS25DRAFT_490794 [Hypoxylon fragiforme]KAI2608560.1 hypothetical protein GGS25DRAFT_490794 [Hypoxylon fragiforme]
MAVTDKGPMIIGVTMMFEVIALGALCLRFWSQQLLRRKIYAHDIFTLFGFICATALTACLICSVQYGGLGRHAIELLATPEKLVVFGKLLIAVQALWAFSMTSIRLSILHLYLHLFTTHRRFRIVCWALMAACLLWALGDLLTVFLLCRPLAFNWNKLIPGRCGNINAAYLSVHSTNFAIDSTIALLPTPVLWGLQLPIGRKLGVCLMFALGALICAISIARICLYQLALGYDQSDFTWSGSTLYLFTALEPLIACSLACMPLLRPVSEKLSASPVVTWAKSWVTYSTSGSSRFGRGQQSGDTGNDSLEGGLTVTTIGGGSNRFHWRRLSGDSRGIRVKYQVDQESVEMRGASP